MELSAFSVLDAFPPSLDRGRDRYAEALGLAEAADKAGLSTFWVAEHHFHSGGLCPSPPVLLAAAGARTRRVRLGVLVSVLPFHRAVDVAEEYALLDQIVGGRLNLGFGSGYIPLEFEGFGIDPAAKRDLFDRNLASILAAWRGEPFSSDGGTSRRVRLNIVPRQRPHPPLWIAVQRREAIPFVGRRGANLALVPYATVSSLADLGGEIREYRASLPAGASGKVSVALPIYAGSSTRRGREALQRYLDARLQTQSTFYTQRVQSDPHQTDAAGLMASGFAIIGTPQEAITRLLDYASLGVDEVLGIYDFGGLAETEVNESVRGLAAAWFARMRSEQP